MLPYGRQSIDESDISAVVDVLRGDWLTQGPTVENFEHAVRDYVGARHAVAFSSGTAALHGAAWAAGLGPGKRVFTPSLTFMATVNAVRYVGAEPCLVDIDERSFNIDLALIPSNAEAVIPVHFAGLPVDLENSAWLSRPKVIIEDASHALGAHTQAGPVGNCAHSEMTCFSFHPVKPITTGEGGMVTTNDSELAERLRLFRSHGIVRKPELGAWYYEISDVGFNYRMTDIQAALGLSQISRLDTFVRRRNEIAREYRKAIDSLTSFQSPPEASAGALHGYHLFVIRTERRRELFDFLRKSGLGVQVHYIPAHHHPVSTGIEILPSGLETTDKVYSEIISIPVFPGMGDRDVQKVISLLREYDSQN